MLKQDYMIRMIQEILSFLINIILQKKKFRQQEWEEYDHLTLRILDMSTEKLLHADTEQIMEKYANDSNAFEKMELAAVYMLKLADDLGGDSLVYRAKLKQEALQLLDYIQKEGNTFSLSRMELINYLKKDN